MNDVVVKELFAGYFGQLVKTSIINSDSYLRTAMQPNCCVKLKKSPLGLQSA